MLYEANMSNSKAKVMCGSKLRVLAIESTFSREGGGVHSIDVTKKRQESEIYTNLSVTRLL